MGSHERIIVFVRFNSLWSRKVKSPHEKGGQIVQIVMLTLTPTHRFESTVEDWYFEASHLSADAEWVAFEEDGFCEGDPEIVRLVHLESGKEKRVSGYTPRWHPTEPWLLTLRNKEILLHCLDEKKEELLYSHKQTISDLTWSPSGEEVCFTTEKGAIFILSVEETEIREVLGLLPSELVDLTLRLEGKVRKINTLGDRKDRLPLTSLVWGDQLLYGDFGVGLVAGETRLPVTPVGMKWTTPVYSEARREWAFGVTVDQRHPQTAFERERWREQGREIKQSEFLCRLTLKPLSIQYIPLNFRIRALAFSLDGTFLALGGEREAEIWMYGEKGSLSRLQSIPLPNDFGEDEIDEPRHMVWRGERLALTVFDKVVVYNVS